MHAVTLPKESIKFILSCSILTITFSSGIYLFTKNWQIMVIPIPLILIWLCYYRWEWGLYVFLAFIPFEGIVIMASSSSKIAVLAEDLFILLPVYLGFIHSRIITKKRFSFPGSPVVPIICFMMLTLIHLFNPNLINFKMGFIGLKVWLFYIPLYFLAHNWIDSKQKLLKVAKFTVGLAIIPAIIGIIQVILYHLGFKEILYSIYGTYSNISI